MVWQRYTRKIPLGTVLSLPGSCHEKLTKVLTSWFDDIQEAKIEDSTQSVFERLEEAVKDDEEVLISRIVKKLYISVPAEEAIEMVVDLKYAQDNQREVDRSIFKALMRLAVTKVTFNSSGKRLFRWVG